MLLQLLLLLLLQSVDCHETTRRSLRNDASTLVDSQSVSQSFTGALKSNLHLVRFVVDLLDYMLYKTSCTTNPQQVVHSVVKYLKTSILFK